jgi:hypothetical protein
MLISILMPVSPPISAPCNIIIASHPMSTNTRYPHFISQRGIISGNRHRNNLIITKLSCNELWIVQFRAIYVITIPPRKNCLTDNCNVIGKPLWLITTCTAHQNGVLVKPLGFNPFHGVVQVGPPIKASFILQNPNSLIR